MMVFMAAGGMGCCILCCGICSTSSRFGLVWPGRDWLGLVPLISGRMSDSGLSDSPIRSFGILAFRLNIPCTDLMCP